MNGLDSTPKKFGVKDKMLVKQLVVKKLVVCMASPG